MSNSELIGSSTNFRAVLEKVNRVAPTNCAVLIQGETGTGAAIPAALLESELFGHSAASCAHVRPRFPAGCLLDLRQRPAYLAERNHLLPLLFVQDIAHIAGAYFLRLSQCPDYVLIGRFSGDHHWRVS